MNYWKKPDCCRTWIQAEKGCLWNQWSLHRITGAIVIVAQNVIQRSLAAANFGDLRFFFVQKKCAKRRVQQWQSFHWTIWSVLACHRRCTTNKIFKQEKKNSSKKYLLGTDENIVNVCNTEWTVQNSSSLPQQTVSLSFLTSFCVLTNDQKQRRQLRIYLKRKPTMILAPSHRHLFAQKTIKKKCNLTMITHSFRLAVAYRSQWNTIRRLLKRHYEQSATKRVFDFTCTGRWSTMNLRIEQTLRIRWGHETPGLFP